MNTPRMFISLHATVTTLCYTEFCPHSASHQGHHGILDPVLAAFAPFCKFKASLEEDSWSTEKQSDAKWWFGWEKFCRRADKENIRSIHRDKMWEQTPPRTWRHKNENERANSSNLHLLNLQQTSVGALFVCVSCQCATSIPLKVSTNKKIVVKNCFILAAGNGGREKAWRKNSAENIRGWKNPFVLWLPTANPALLYCTKIVSEKFTEM